MKADVDPTSSTRIGAGELYQEHAGFVASFLSRLGIGRDDLADLVQEVFLIAHRKGGFEPGRAHPRTWLAAIAFRVASGHRRRRRPVLSDDHDLAVSAADPEQTLQAQQAAERVHRCLESLDLPHRAVFVLFEIEAMSGVEIAETLEVPVGTVYRRLHEARKSFAAMHEQLERKS